MNMNIALADNHNNGEMKVSVRTSLVSKFYKQDKEGKRNTDRGIYIYEKSKIIIIVRRKTKLHSDRQGFVPFLNATMV